MLDSIINNEDLSKSIYKNVSLLFSTITKINNKTGNYKKLKKWLTQKFMKKYHNISNYEYDKNSLNIFINPKLFEKYNGWIISNEFLNEEFQKNIW